MNKITINNKELLSVLRKYKSVVPTNPIMSIIENVLFVCDKHKVELRCSNLEITISSSIKCESDEQFSFLLPFELIFKISELTGDENISIEMEGEDATVICGDDIFEIKATGEPTLFPKTPEIETWSNPVTLPVGFIDTLNSAIATTTKGTTTHTETTKVCIDVKPDNISVVSMNQLSIFSKKFEINSGLESEVLISERCIRALSFDGEIKFCWCKTHAIFSSDSMSVFATIHDGKFVPYRSVMPPAEPTLTVNRDEFIYGIKKSTVTDGSHTSNVTISLKEKDGSIFIESSNIDGSKTSKVEIQAEYTGENEVIIFNAHNILKVLNQIDYRDVQLSIKDRKTGVIISSIEDHSYLGLAMPMIK